MPSRNLMSSRVGRVVALAAALALTAATTAAATAPPPSPSMTVYGYAPYDGAYAGHDACPAATIGWASCLAVVSGVPVTWAHGASISAQASGGAAAAQEPYFASDLRSAYNLPSKLFGSRQTVAIVDAYDDPSAAADLAVYRAANHLPACTASYPCFEKVNQEGQQGNYPASDSGWGVEESLDVNMVSAICPNCKILLVEADDNANDDLAASVNEAVKLGATVVSNSYGGPEYAGELSQMGSAYNHPGVVMTVASGDDSYGAMVPAAFSTVVSVGGTTLYRNSSKRGWQETDWTGSGSGCSAYVAKPAWQHDKLCGMRTVADVSAVADPATGVAVYDSFGEPGWLSVGGTSVASPIIAGVYALAGNGASINPGSYLYAHTADLNDVTSGFEYTSGANGDCGGSYLCLPVKGYDGPTGNGTPNGLAAF